MTWEVIYYGYRQRVVKRSRSWLFAKYCAWLYGRLSGGRFVVVSGEKP